MRAKPNVITPPQSSNRQEINMRNLKDSTQRWLTLLFLISAALIWLSASGTSTSQAKMRAWLSSVVTPSAAMAQTQDSRISPEAQRQIQALMDEKESRTPAQRKIDSQLIYAMKLNRGDNLKLIVPTLQANVDVDSDGKTMVD